MKTSRTLKSSPPLKQAKGGYTPESFVDRNLLPVNPLKQQFEPTEASQVRQHYKMAGGCD